MKKVKKDFDQYCAIDTKIEQYNELDNDDKYNVLKEFFNIKEEDFMKLDYIVNNNSHNEPMLNIEKWFDPKILQQSCIIISNMIRERFSQLYDYCLRFNKEEI